VQVFTKILSCCWICTKC